MSLYPTLEDMKVDHMAKAQTAHISTPPYPTANNIPQVQYSPSNSNGLYPALDNYMGMSMNEMSMQISKLQPMQVSAQRSGATVTKYVAPITGTNNTSLMRAEVKQGIRMVVLCKNQEGKIGLRVQSVNKGVFVSFVQVGSAAALAGLRFGDQILEINGNIVAGWDISKTTKFIKNSDAKSITFAIRDRPFERTITLQKDSAGTVGFIFKDNKITSIVKDSSAARNGVLIDNHLVEVNGQNVVGLKEKDIKNLFDGCGMTVTITIIPSFLYDHIIKNIGSGLIKGMDHSIPDL